jgi:RimJ/RimL family protein N-acetyltransferase
MTLYVGPYLGPGRTRLVPADPQAIRLRYAGSDIAVDFESCLSAGESRSDTLYFSVEHDGALFGQILLHDIDTDRGTALAAYHLLDPGSRSRGVGTEALMLLLDYAREHTGLERLAVLIGSDNEPSRRIAEKCGFEFRGASPGDPHLVVYGIDLQTPRGRADGAAR